MLRLTSTLLLLIFVIINIASSQKLSDKGKFINYKNPYWEQIKKSVEDFEEEKKEPKKSFKMDYTGYTLPKSGDEFKQQWHNTPISQGWSGMCWNFATTSLFESEIYRLQGKQIKISELHTTYYEYVEKARRYVQERGNSLFAEGSEANAVKKIWSKYGCVPADVYTGKKEGQKHHGHKKMFKEMKDYLISLKKSNAWNEELVLETIKSILNHYIGTPQKSFKFEGKDYTSLTFFKDVVKLNLDDYIDVLSIMQQPYFKTVEYEVPDNWWHNEDYHNVPLDMFMAAIKEAVESGYTLEIGGDVSESGYNSFKEVAMVPSYDIPAEYIDENARQFRFSNKTTTDDHGIHIVGYKVDDKDKYWFLIKDSGSGARNGKNKGYYFYHEDYVKLKMMTFMVHRDAIKKILAKFK